MKKYFNCCLLLCMLLLVLPVGNYAAPGEKPAPRILIFSKTAGFHHGSINDGNLAIMKLGAEHNFGVDTTTDASKFTKRNLRKYAAVVFLSPTGLSTQLFNEDQKEAFKAYIQAGRGFVGIHAATDCCYDWQWYGNLVGAFFGGHPATQTAVLNVVDLNNAATKMLPAQWKRKDEWYSFKWMAAGLNVLIKLDEGSYKPGKNAMGAEHPIAWYHDFDGGRSFYTGLGHTPESYQDPQFLMHLLGGIQYAMGKKYKVPGN